MHDPKVILAGSGIGVLLLPAHLFLSHSSSVLLAALTLAVIAGAYIGFGARQAEPGIFVLEFTVAAAFALAAFFGATLLPVIIPLALIAHGFWDWLHLHPRLRAVTPAWYPPFCAIVDFIAGGGLLAIWLVQGIPL